MERCVQGSVKWSYKWPSERVSIAISTSVAGTRDTKRSDYTHMYTQEPDKKSMKLETSGGEREKKTNRVEGQRSSLFRGIGKEVRWRGGGGGGSGSGSGSAACRWARNKQTGDPVNRDLS